MILSDLKIMSKVHLQCEFSGIDRLENCLNKDHFRNYPHKVDYVYNSRGFRDVEWPESREELKNAIWCIGDSFTVGVGSPYNFTWPQMLSAATGRRCINVSMDGASNNWISRRAQQIIKEVAPTHMVVLWSYLHRRESADITWPDEDRRLISTPASDMDDFTNFVQCYQQLNTDRISTNIYNSLIPNYYYDPNCSKIWNNIRDPSWPAVCPRSESEFAALPEYIQQELFLQPDNKSKFEVMFASNEFFDYYNVLQLTNLDYARDYHHFDDATSKFFVQQIYKTLFSNSQIS
jgi:hypothetical protein